LKFCALSPPEIENSCIVRSDPTCNQIDRVTPPGLSFDQRMDQLVLFTCVCGMRQINKPLRRQLAS